MIGPSERQIVSFFIKLYRYVCVLHGYTGYPIMFSQECQLAI